MPASFKVENAVKDRYSVAASTRVEALCCPVQYDDRYLKVIPKEILERDYGCGDPSRYVVAGETVLDLGSGAGKICFIASQVVGPQGRVIGVDMNDDMLELARGARKQIGDAIGWHNVEFRKGRIQDLALDLDALQSELEAHPIHSAAAFLTAEAKADELRHTRPLVAADTIDVVVSNCVLNLVSPREKGKLFEELFRVVKPGGRAVISDIVADQSVPEALQHDPELWSGCISGALTEEAFLVAFEKAGFRGVEILKRDAKPWRTVHGIEFRSVTVRAFKLEPGRPSDHSRAVIYRGPFSQVTDEQGNQFRRGQRLTVSESVFNACLSGPYRDHFFALEAPSGNSKEAAKSYDFGLSQLLATPPSASCCNESDCCKG